MATPESSGTDVLTDLVPPLRDAGRSARHQLELLAERGRARVGRVLEASGGEHEAEAVAAAARRAGHSGIDALERTGLEVRRVGEQTTSAAQAIAAQAAAAAVARAEQAFERGAVLADLAIERVPDLSRRVSDEVMPTVRETAQHAATAALELWHAARERAAEAAPHADPARLARPAVQAAHLAAAGSEKVRESSAAAADRAAAIGERARDVSRRGAAKTADTSRDTGALLFWAGAALGLIVFALLSAERRAALAGAARGVTSEVRAMIQDFQGYDDEF